MHKFETSFLPFPRAHMDRRIWIERVNGQLKNKFRCLLGDGLQIQPDGASDMIIAVWTLSNICESLILIHIMTLAVQQSRTYVDRPGADDELAAGAIRTKIINDNFAQWLLCELVWSDFEFVKFIAALQGLTFEKIRRRAANHFLLFAIWTSFSKFVNFIKFINHSPQCNTRWVLRWVIALPPQNSVPGIVLQTLFMCSRLV